MQIGKSENPSIVDASTPLRIAHLVNVFSPQSGSEFEWVQPITLETMRIAKAATSSEIDVTLYTAQFSEDFPMVPTDFHATADLERSVRDVWNLASLPPFPFIADLLRNLYENSTAEYLIYTNIDIGLQPHFYNVIAQYIRQGHDAFIVNRRRIPEHYRNIGELPAMYKEKGKPHPGFDCFVFHRDLYPKFKLGLVCIGVPYIEILMGQNLFCHARNFKLFEDDYLTFHIGEDVFKKRDKFLLGKNRNEFWKAVHVLWPHLDSRKFPWGERALLVRLLKWGLHPCIPIRLCLRLELRQLLGK